MPHHHHHHHGGGFHGGFYGHHHHHHHHGGFYPGIGIGGFGSPMYPVMISAPINPAPHVDVYVQPPSNIGVPVSTVGQGPRYAQYPTGPAPYPGGNVPTQFQPATGYNGQPSYGPYPPGTLAPGYQNMSASRSLPETSNISPSNTLRPPMAASALSNKSNSSEMLYNRNSDLIPQPTYNPAAGYVRPPAYSSNNSAQSAAFSPNNFSYASAPPMDNPAEQFGPPPTYNEVIQQQQHTTVTKM